jgi:serine/threonine protein kinase/WD40 repeat protein
MSDNLGMNSELDKSMVARLVAYDELVRNGQWNSEAGRSLELDNPEAAKAIRAIREVLGNRSDPSPSSIAWLNGIPERFDLQEELGSGSFGIVYKAYDKWLQHMVALKVMRPELMSNAKLRQRFLRESRAAARLNHPYIVRILEASESTTAIWQVCDLVEGSSLSEHLVATRLDVPTAVRILRDLADAVSHAHSSNVLHRDIKPDNILLNCKPGEPLEQATARLTDFGLARIIDCDMSQMSYMGMLVGTPRYMAPEQLTGNVEEHGVGTDVYALGIILFELLTGNCPFEESTTISQRVAGLAKPIRSMQKLSPKVPKDLASIGAKCLENRIEDRYDSAAALRDDLDRFLRGEPTHARPYPIHEQLVRWTIRNRALASIFAILAVASFLVVGLTVRNNTIYQSKNTILSKTIEQIAAQIERITAQELIAQGLYESAEKLRAEAVVKQDRFQKLAWTKGMRETYAAWNALNYAEVRRLMASMLATHPDAASRMEWRILNAEMRKHVRLMLDLPCAINEIRSIPKSRWIAAAAGDGNVYLLDFETGKIDRTIETGISSLHALAVSHDGKLLAVGGRTDPNAEIDLALPKIFQIRDGRLLKVLEGQPTTIESLAFSGNDKQLACGARYEPLKVFDLEIGTTTSLSSVAKRHEWIAVSMDGESVTAQSTERSIWKTKFNSPFAGQLIRLPHFSHCSQWLAGSDLLINARSNVGEMSLYSCGEERIKGYLVGGSVNDPYIHIAVQPIGPNQSVVASGSKGGSIGIWFVDSQDPLFVDSNADPKQNDQILNMGMYQRNGVQEYRNSASWQVSLEPVTSLAFVDRWLFVSTVSGELIRIDTPLDSIIPSRLRPNKTPVEPYARSGDWAPDGSYAIVGSFERIDRIAVPNVVSEKKLPNHSSETLKVSVHDLLTSEQTEHAVPFPEIDTQVKNGFVPAIAFAPDGQSVASVLADGIAIWTADGERFWHRSVPPKDTRRQSNLSYSPDSNRLVWDAEERVLSIAELDPTEMRVETLEQPGSGDTWAWSPSGQRLAFGGSYSQILEVDFSTKKTTAIVDYGVFTKCLAYNGEDQILSGHPDGAIRAWDRNSRTNTLVKAHSGEVCDITLLDQGRIGISVDVSGNVGVWFAKEPEALGLITHDFQTAYNNLSMPPTLWTDSKSVLRLLYNDVRGSVSIKQWELDE